MSTDTTREAVERSIATLVVIYGDAEGLPISLFHLFDQARALLSERDAAVRHYEQSLNDRSAAIVARMDADAERDAAHALLPAAWEAGAVVGFDAGFSASGEGWNGEYPESVMSGPMFANMKAEHLAALRPPPDLAEQLSRETKG